MDTFSNGFGRNQMRRYVNELRRVKKEVKKIKAQLGNMNYNYHFESDTYSDDWVPSSKSLETSNKFEQRISFVSWQNIHEVLINTVLYLIV